MGGGQRNNNAYDLTCAKYIFDFNLGLARYEDTVVGRNELLSPSIARVLTSVEHDRSPDVVSARQVTL